MPRLIACSSSEFCQQFEFMALIATCLNSVFQFLHILETSTKRKIFMLHRRCKQKDDVFVWIREILSMALASNNMADARGSSDRSCRDSKLTSYRARRTKSILRKVVKFFLAQVTSKKVEDRSEEKRLEDAAIRTEISGQSLSEDIAVFLPARKLPFHEFRGQSERTIQTLEDMLRACVLDFGKANSWSYRSRTSREVELAVHSTFHVLKIEEMHDDEIQLAITSREVKRHKAEPYSDCKDHWKLLSCPEFSWERGKTNAKRKYPRTFHKLTAPDAGVPSLGLRPKLCGQSFFNEERM
ncbi:hypothetical protein Tco_1352502 [Tanacetum coccineum]